MSNISGINHEGLRTAIIELQNDSKLAYYGYFAMYFNFTEKPNLPAPAGVTITNKRLQFVYNVEELNKACSKSEAENKSFLKFLVIHECQHILLSHSLRKGERNQQLANIAMDMVINTMIEEDHGLSFKDYYYSNRKYEYPSWDPAEYTGQQIFEEIYDKLLDNEEKENQKNKNNKGNGNPSDDKDGPGGKGDGNPSANGKENPEANGKGKGKLVDDHESMNESTDEQSDAEKAIMDNMIKEIHETMKARGFSASAGIEAQFNITKKKPLVNVFKRVFGNGKVKSPTYRKLSRRVANLKGKRKESKDVNLILDTSGSLYDELSEILPYVIGNHNIFCIQIDTSIKFEGTIKSLAEWKKVSKAGGGGTTLQPALDRLAELGRGKIQTIFVSDYYCEELDLAGIKAPITFVKSRSAINPVYKNKCGAVRVVQSQLDVDGNQ